MDAGLIVHADDFGLASWVNRGIVQAHRDGIVTSTSLMATGQAFVEAVDLARDLPSLDLGVHLTLTEELPAADPAQVGSLLDQSGCLHRHALTFARRLTVGAIDLAQVRLELSAQICRVVAACGPVSHLDGHQHVHMLPGIRGIVGDLAREHGIPCIRYPRERPASYMLRDAASPGRLAQLALLNACCAAGGRPALAAPGAFFGFHHGGRLDSDALSRIIAALPSGRVSELMCHPGQTPDAETYDHWGYRWQDELRALTAPGLAASLRLRGINLLSYRDLAAREADGLVQR